MEITTETRDLMTRLITEMTRRLSPEQVTPERLWSRDEAAAYLGVRPQTLACWYSQGRGPAVTKLGRRSLYQPEIVRDYAKQQTCPR